MSESVLMGCGEGLAAAALWGFIAKDRVSSLDAYLHRHRIRGVIQQFQGGRGGARELVRDRDGGGRIPQRDGQILFAQESANIPGKHSRIANAIGEFDTLPLPIA